MANFLSEIATARRQKPLPRPNIFQKGRYGAANHTDVEADQGAGARSPDSDRTQHQPGSGFGGGPRSCRDALTLRESNYPPVHYIPRKDVDMSLLDRTDHGTYCLYRGDCSYFSIPLGGSRGSLRL